MNEAGLHVCIVRIILLKQLTIAVIQLPMNVANNGNHEQAIMIIPPIIAQIPKRNAARIFAGIKKSGKLWK